MVMNNRPECKDCADSVGNCFNSGIEDKCPRFKPKKEEPKKWDEDKLEWHLLPYEAIEEIVKVLMLGKGRYGANNWKGFESDLTRVMDAAQRHLAAIQKGEEIDESGLLHEAHLACNAVFLIYFRLVKGDKSEKHTS